MDIIIALVMGLIQGVTEWLPVSSTGHLVLAQEIMQIPAAESILFDISLHAATLVAVIVFLRKDFVKILTSMVSDKKKLDRDGLISRKLGWLALLATIPAIVSGLLLSNYLEEIFTPAATAIALLVTGTMLWFAELPGLRKNREGISIKDSLIIGCFQAASVVPGISRSGSTISAGCYVGLNRQLVATFSFLLSIPIIVAALAYNLTSVTTEQIDLISLLAASIIAFIVGLIALRWLFDLIKKFRMRIFSVYCWAVGIIVLIVLALS